MFRLKNCLGKKPNKAIFPITKVRQSIVKTL